MENQAISNGSGHRAGRFLASVNATLRNNAAIAITFLGVILGFVVGVVLRSWRHFTPYEVMLVGFPGEIFVRMVKMLLIPLVVSSIISAVSQVNAKVVGSLGLRVLLYCVGTTFVSTTLGVLVGHWLQAGRIRETVVVRDSGPSLEISTVIMDTIRNCVPENLIAACFQKVTTFKEDVVFPVIDRADNETMASNEVTSVFEQRMTPGTNVLGVMLFSIVFGIVLTQMMQRNPRAEILIRFFTSLNEAVFKLVNVMMWLCPIGILSLVAEKIVKKGGAGDIFYVALLYCVIASSLLMAHALIVLPALFFALTRNNPYALIRSAIPAMTVAFGSESSAITLPTTLKCLDNYGVSPAIYKFVAPITMTVNMNGAGLSYGMVAVFIAQYDNIALTSSDLFVIIVMAMTTAFMGAAMPTGGASFTSVAIIFQPVNLPVNDFVYVLPLNWLRARFSTVVNILGDCFCAAIMEKTAAHLLTGTKKSEENNMDDNENKQSID